MWPPTYSNAPIIGTQYSLLFWFILMNRRIGKALLSEETKKSSSCRRCKGLKKKCTGKPTCGRCAKGRKNYVQPPDPEVKQITQSLPIEVLKTLTYMNCKKRKKKCKGTPACNLCIASRKLCLWPPDPNEIDTGIPTHGKGVLSP